MSDTKKCPYCAEEIKIEATKCKHCHEVLENNQDNKKSEKIFLKENNVFVSNTRVIFPPKVNTQQPQTYDINNITEAQLIYEPIGKVILAIRYIFAIFFFLLAIFLVLVCLASSPKDFCNICIVSLLLIGICICICPRNTVICHLKLFVDVGEFIHLEQFDKSFIQKVVDAINNAIKEEKSEANDKYNSEELKIEKKDLETAQLENRIEDKASKVIADKNESDNSDKKNELEIVKENLKDKRFEVKTDVLIKCPKCNKDVSNKTINCPNCGFSISEHLKRQYGYIKFFGILCLFGVISWIIIGIIHLSKIKAEPPTMPEINNFMSAVKANNVSKAKELLNKNPNLLNVNDRTSVEMTPLLGAARYGNKEMVEFLLSEGADINVKNKRNETFLHQAAIGGSKEIAEIGLNKGLDVNAKCNMGDTPLLLALSLCEKVNYDLIKLLISNGADINAKNDDGSTPLHWAETKEIAELLISKGGDVNAKDTGGNTPLHWVRNKEIAELLILKGADINAKNEYGSTPLHYARSGIKHKEVAELLISKGAEVKVTNFKEFLSKYINEMKDPDFLIDRIMLNDEPLAMEIIKNNKSLVNCKSKGDLTPLICALMFGSPKEVIESLISNGADVNLSSDTATPLTMGVRYENYATSAKEIMELLISNGADVNVKDGCGYTALDWAKEKNNVEIIELLIKGPTSISETSENTQKEEYVNIKKLFSEAQNFLKKKKYKEAIECYDKIIANDHENADAWFYKGEALYELGRPEEEIKCYDKVLEINPNNADAWFNKGEALYDLGHAGEEEIECYDKALAINPNYIDAWFNKGLALHDLGRYDEAIYCYDKVLEDNPEDTVVQNKKNDALKKSNYDGDTYIPNDSNSGGDPFTTNDSNNGGDPFTTND